MVSLDRSESRINKRDLGDALELLDDFRRTDFHTLEEGTGLSSATTRSLGKGLHAEFGREHALSAALRSDVLARSAGATLHFLPGDPADLRGESQHESENS